MPLSLLLRSTAGTALLILAACGGQHTIGKLGTKTDTVGGGNGDQDGGSACGVTECELDSDCELAGKAGATCVQDTAALCPTFTCEYPAVDGGSCGQIECQQDSDCAKLGKPSATCVQDTAALCLTFTCETPTTDGGTKAAGAACKVDSECGGGLLCCYPCGIPGCASDVCTAPAAGGGCPTPI